MTLFIVIEEISPINLCIQNEYDITCESINELSSLLGIDFADDEKLEFVYEINIDQINSLKKYFNIDYKSEFYLGRIRSKKVFDELPYKIHTGRELILMLSGVKPMAYFVSYDDEFEDELQRPFDFYVHSNAINRREFSLVLGKKILRKAKYVVYTLPGDDWRADALILLKKSGFKSGWSEGLERMEGSLLGYEDWQNDIFIEKIYKNNI